MRQKKKISLLVLGSDRNRAFVKTLKALRFDPTFLGSMEAVLHALRHVQASAILVDRNGKKADDLELVLNIRDLDERIPIILIGSPAEGQTETLLWRQPATFLIHKPANDPSLRQELRQFLAAEAPVS